jgi:hypothetical protein
MKSQKKKKTQTNKSEPTPLINNEKQTKWSDYTIKILLLGFGVWMSIYYFGFLASPNPDFPGFPAVARELLHFHQPGSYKRVPVHGFFVALAALFTQSSPRPDLVAGWVVCAILYPFTILLIYLLGRQFIGRWAIWLALISSIQDWYVQSLVDPIAEMTLLFFILLTFYFIFRRSRWAYLFAAITSMVRYEGAALILAAFVWDMLEAKNWRQRGKAFAYSAAASVPLMLWAIGTIMNWSHEGGHYIQEMGEASGGKFVFFGFIKMLWDSGFKYLFLPPTGASSDVSDFLFKLNSILVILSFGFGAGYSLFKRNWKVLMLLIFLLPYICIHAAHSFLFPRFGMPVNWLILLLTLYGLYSLYHLINKNNRISKLLIIAMQVVAAFCFALWFFGVYPYLKNSASLSHHSVPIPYVVLSIAVIFSAISAYLHHFRFLRADIVAFTILAVAVISNQYFLVQRIGNGDLDIEFIHLTDWYSANAKPGELMATTMAGPCTFFDTAHASSYVNIGDVNANSPDEFVKECLLRNITYIVWDTRSCGFKGGRFYKTWHLDYIEQLAFGKSVGPYEFITTLKGAMTNGFLRVAHIYRLKKTDS